MLEVTWFALWGILWAVYLMLDGFDLGIGAMLPFLAKNERQKRVLFNVIGPFWDGNEVWLITAGGATFAAFPKTYAVMFSALYSPLLLILFALIIRGVAVPLRNEHDSPAWTRLWDTCLAVGSFLPALLFGVAFANIFSGIPIGKDGVYEGTILTLLNPYGILGGLFFVAMFTLHGLLWTAVKSEGELEQRAWELAPTAWVIVLVLAVIFLVATAFATNLYDNYLSSPALFILPAITVACLMLTRLMIKAGKQWKAWLFSCGMIATAVLFGVVGLFPNMLPSSINQAHSLTIHNAASSPKTLTIMLVVVLIFLPVVIGYQVWVYKLFSHKVNEDDAAHSGGHY